MRFRQTSISECWLKQLRFEFQGFPGEEFGKGLLHCFLTWIVHDDLCSQVDSNPLEGAYEKERHLEIVSRLFGDGTVFAWRT